MDRDNKKDNISKTAQGSKSGLAPCSVARLRVLDLFSGIGGFSLGLERTGGFETIAFCEQDEFCQKVLRKHWPDVPIYNDVRTIENVKADVVTGGYPCQPFSVAGSQKAEKDDRHLWPEMLRIITQTRPTWVIAENVYGHVSLGLDKVLFDMESAGYSGRPIVIPACATGKPHRRDRVYVVAYSASNGCNESTTSSCHDAANEHGKKRANKNCNNERCSRLRSGMDRNSGANWRGGIEPPALRVDDGLPNRMDRNKCLGNSLIPQIPEILGMAILAQAA